MSAAPERPRHLRGDLWWPDPVLFRPCRFPAPPGQPMPNDHSVWSGGQTVGTALLQPVSAMVDPIPSGAGVHVQVGGPDGTLEKPQFFGFLFDASTTGWASDCRPVPMSIGQPGPAPGGPPGVGQALSRCSLSTTLALQTVPEPATPPPSEPPPRFFWVSAVARGRSKLPLRQPPACATTAAFRTLTRADPDRFDCSRNSRRHSPLNRTWAFSAPSRHEPGPAMLHLSSHAPPLWSETITGTP